MIESFLRRPHGMGEVVADLIRLTGAGSFLAAAVGWGLQEAGIFALVLLGLLMPRFIRVRALFDSLFGLALLVAAWSAVADLYTSVPGWDVVVHFLTNGVAAAMIYLLLERLAVVPPVHGPGARYVSSIVVTVQFGLAVGVLWELLEWLGHNFLDQTIYVGYDDTIGDLAAGGLGAVVAGCALKMMAAHEPKTSESRPIRVDRRAVAQ